MVNFERTCSYRVADTWVFLLEWRNTLLDQIYHILVRSTIMLKVCRITSKLRNDRKLNKKTVAVLFFINGNEWLCSIDCHRRTSNRCFGGSRIPSRFRFINSPPESRFRFINLSWQLGFRKTSICNCKFFLRRPAYWNISPTTGINWSLSWKKTGKKNYILQRNKE